jgi:N-terminal 7TM region of histidine kinase
MVNLLVGALRTLNELLTAGIAITAFSLLLYALSFNLRDRVARMFAAILLCVVTVFVSEALGSVASVQGQLNFWLHLQWVGIVFLPATYLHFSDALLATTGRPSRGRRRLAVRLVYLASLAFLAALPFNLLVGPLIPDAQPAPHLQRTWLTWVFTGFYGTIMLLAGYNFWRAYKRTVASTSRRRMTYLLAGALAPALGSYPYLLFGSSFAARHQLIFWLAVIGSNLLVSALLVLMAYAVAFFGVPWPDRVVKRRLFKWLLRGPVTGSTVLAITTILRRAGIRLGLDLSAIVPVVMVGSILVLEHIISLFATTWERWLFLGKDRAEMELLQTLDERLLTQSDLQQFLEALLAAVCDRLQAPQAFIAALEGDWGGSELPGGTEHRLEMLVSIGGDDALEEENLSENLLQAVTNNGGKEPRGKTTSKSREANGSNEGGGKDQLELFSWGKYWLAALSDPEGKPGELIGLLGVMHQPEQSLDGEQREALSILADRAALALRDRARQQQAFSSLEELTPQMDMIQSLRAAARYDGTEMLTTPSFALEQEYLAPWVKDALTHYWGGPKLTQNPLLGLHIVQKTAQDNKESPTNALRTILRKAIEHVRPEGERRFTAEWILYNILEMKFLEGRKVREIAMRLAMSEADLYRKQRVAIEAVASAIVDMEKQATHER